MTGKPRSIRAQEAIGPGNTAEARVQLLQAKAAFDRMKSEIDGLGPLGSFMRVVPFVRVQVKGVDAILKAGQLLSDAGIELSNAIDKISATDDTQSTAGRILPQLATIHTALKSGSAKTDEAAKAVHKLDKWRLLGPLNTARNELVAKLDPVARQAHEAETGMTALEIFFGKKGPRRYLVFSQNPEEVRPTGGYMGSFSVMTTSASGVNIEQTTPIEDWQAAHPDIQISSERLGGIFQFGQTPSLANVNFLPDWTIAGNYAAGLWKRGGETPVDGVLGVTPGFLRQLLEVTGPINVPEYGETVSAENIIERFAFHTKQVALRLEDNSVRKGFAGQSAKAVLNASLSAPRSRWKDLGIALGKSFDKREAMMWSPDATVADPLSAWNWDGTLPRGEGDFFYNAEFSFGSKNGRSLQRTFDHHVVLKEDGSATITTKMTVANSVPRDRLNPTSLAYVIAYGPTGARLSAAAKPVTPHEVSLGGHPGSGFFVDPLPFEKDQFTVVWSSANLAQDLPGRDWSYDLRFMHVPDHKGDVVNLRVDLPGGGRGRATSHPPPRRSMETLSVPGRTARDLVDGTAGCRACVGCLGRVRRHRQDHRELAGRRHGNRGFASSHRGQPG